MLSDIFTVQKTMNVFFGSVLQTHAHEIAHTHITQSLKESVSLLYSDV